MRCAERVRVAFTFLMGIAMYQKDGAGSLRRLYLDRILSPRKLATLENRRLDEIPKLTCPKCKEDIGVPHIYKKEKRKAFRLYQDALAKKIKKLEDQRRLGI